MDSTRETRRPKVRTMGGGSFRNRENMMKLKTSRTPGSNILLGGSFLQTRTPGSTIILLLDIPDIEEFVKLGEWASSTPLLDKDGFRWTFQARAHTQRKEDEAGTGTPYLEVRLRRLIPAEGVVRVRMIEFVRFNVLDLFDGTSLHSQELNASERDGGLDGSLKIRYWELQNFCPLDEDAVKRFCPDGKGLHLAVEFGDDPPVADSTPEEQCTQFGSIKESKEEEMLVPAAALEEGPPTLAQWIRDCLKGLIVGILIAFLIAAFAGLPLPQPMASALKNVKKCSICEINVRML